MDTCWVALFYSMAMLSITDIAKSVILRHGNQLRGEQLIFQQILTHTVIPVPSNRAYVRPWVSFGGAVTPEHEARWMKIPKKRNDNIN